MARKIKLTGKQKGGMHWNRITSMHLKMKWVRVYIVSGSVGVCLGGRGGERRRYLKAEIKYGKRQVVSKVGSILREEEEVVMEGEEHEVEESQEVWPDVDCLISTHEGTVSERWGCMSEQCVWVSYESVTSLHSFPPLLLPLLLLTPLHPPTSLVL